MRTDLSQDLSNVAQGIVHEVSKQKDKIINDSLNELISSGLLVVEQTEPVLVEFHDPTSPGMKYEFRQSVRLVLKDRERMESLERENTELKGRLNLIIMALGSKEINLNIKEILT